MAGFPNTLIDLAARRRVCKVFGVKVVQAVELLHLVHNAGFDGVFIDLEHSALSLESANRICVQAMPLQLSPFVRVPFQCGRGFVQRVLDGGAQGVIFPHVDTVEQAQEAVFACKYPPMGKRSITGALPQFDYKSLSISETVERGNRDMSLVFIMVESKQAVDSVESMASVEGVDVIMVGTNDLSIELGVPGQWDHPDFVAAMNKISMATKRHHRCLAIAGIYDRPDFLQRCLKEWGAGWIVVQHDLAMMTKFLGEAIRDFDRVVGI